MGQILLFTLMFFQDSPLDQARTLSQNNDFYGAEGLLLSQELEDDQVAAFGEQLAELAFIIAATREQVDGKRSFYQGYLSRSRAWRGVSLFVLSAISVQQQAWDELRKNGVLLLQEYAVPQSAVKFRLLYHLARHTNTAPDLLNLNEVESAWFLACRAAAPDQLLPDPVTQLPYFLKNLPLLYQTQDFEIPPVSQPDDAERYLGYLFRIKQALLAEDLVLASKAINELNPFDRSLSDSALRVHFYPLQQEFFLMWQRPERAERLQPNLELARTRTVFYMVNHPDRIREVVALKEQPEPEPLPVEVTPEPKPKEEVKPEPGKPKTFEALEQRILEDHRGLELEIRGMDPNTTYKKAYKNYLFGLFYLKSKRLDRAWEHLYLADRLVTDYPFAALATKILMTMGDYHQAKGNLKDAEWSRIQAAQLWNLPEHMLRFADSEPPTPSPYRAQIEAALADPTDKVHSLLYYVESEHFQLFRRLAFKHNALTQNPVLGSQLGQVGGQLQRLILSLAEDPGNPGDPKGYNSTLDLWNSLWKQVLPYYREKDMPSLEAIQKTLNNRDRILVFVEGTSQVGVVVISQNQAFVVGLGARANLMRMSEQERFAYLEGRLGPVWQQSGKLWVMLSEAFANEIFVNDLRARMTDPANLGLLFSLEALTTVKSLRECRNILVVGPRDDRQLAGMVAGLPQNRLTWLDDADIRESDLLEQITDNDQIILFGRLAFTGQGLVYQIENGSLPLHQIIHRNNRLCNLTLISPDFTSQVAAMPYLEMISPDAATSFYLLTDPSQFQRVKGRKFGLHLP